MTKERKKTETMPTKDYLKDVRTLEDLQRRKKELRKEVELSRERLDQEFEDWMDLGRSKFKKGLAFTAVTGLASFGIKQLLQGGAEKQQKSGQDIMLGLAKAGGPLQKIRAWIPLLLPILNAVSALLRRKK